MREVEEWERQFLDLGYFVAPVSGVLSNLDHLLKRYEHLIPRAEELGKLGVVRTRKSNLETTIGSGWAWGCDHVFRPELREQALLEIASNEPIPAVVNRILGAARFSGGHAHWSPTRYDYFLHWHRDTRRSRWRFAHPDPRAHMQVCVALTDEAVVRVIPGSHHIELSDPEVNWFLENPHGSHPDQEIAVVPAGHALFLNTFTVHRAESRRPAVRRSLHFGFTRVGAAPEPGRAPKFQEWLADEAFAAAQRPFLRRCMNNELVYGSTSVESS